MSDRTAGIFSMRVHPRMKPEQFLDVTNFDGAGADLLVLMRALLVGLPASAIRDDKTKRYVSIEDVDPAGRRLTVTAKVGSYNTPGSTMHVDKHEEEHNRGDRSAATVDTRLVMISPKASTVALLYYERVGSTHAGTTVIELFAKALQTSYPDYMVKSARVTESEAWLEAAELEEVSAATYSHDVEPADQGDPTVRGRLTTRFLPPRGTKTFPSYLWDMLRERKLTASDIFEIEDLDEEVTVHLVNDGRRKSFVLGKEKLPSATYLLSESGESSMTTADIWSLIDEVAPEVPRALGSQWSPSFTAAVWTKEQLDATLPVPD